MVYLTEEQTPARYLQRKEELLETKYARKGSAVYSALAATKLHPSAETLYRDLQEIYPNISRTTVYANLTKLREEGSVICVGVVDGRERYDANTRPHPHFICEQCGAVLDVEGLPEPPSISTRSRCKLPPIRPAAFLPSGALFLQDLSLRF